MSSRPFRRARLQVEALESRWTPATRLSANVLTYQDADSDPVRVTFSKPILTSDAVANSIFVFDQGAVNGNNATPQQLRAITLTGVQGANGTDITVETSFATGLGMLGGSDLHADVGFIQAEGLDLGKVIVRGDLGHITAGDSELATPAMAKLRFDSMGVKGITTQAPGGNLVTHIEGPVGKIVATENIQDAQLLVTGELGLLKIGISLYGGSEQDSGSVSALSIGEVRIGGSIFGGDGLNSGAIFGEGQIGSLTVGGSINGGDGTVSGRVFGNGGIGTVVIAGSLVGGAGVESGSIISDGNTTSITIGGGLLGGAGNNSAQIDISREIGDISIGGSIEGGAGSSSGSIEGRKIRSLEVAGSLIGGGGSESGTVAVVDKIGNVSISGEITGTSTGGNAAAGISAEFINTIFVGGNLRGGGATDNGYVFARSWLGTVTIGGSLMGGAGNFAGWVQCLGDIGDVAIAGDILGGSIAAKGNLGNISVGGSIFGSSDARVRIAAGGRVGPASIESLTVGGDVSYADILAGYDGTYLTPPRSNANARIGRVNVSGHWIASNLVAGVDRGADGRFGSADDGAAVIGLPTFTSRVGPITIAGGVDGTATGGDSFGIVAELVKSLSILGSTKNLTPGALNDVNAAVSTDSNTNDFFLKELEA